MIVITGALGFIGSCIAKELNNTGRTDIIIVDEAENEKASKYAINIKYAKYYEKNEFIKLLESNKIKDIDLIIHMGACSATIETNEKYLMETNYGYSKRLYDWCLKNNCRLIYASSAATYGNGALGYNDNEKEMNKLKPLNTYGLTKKMFDDYILTAPKLKQCVGLKFFNVYGPNEYHKGAMASVVFHSFNQIKEDGKVMLFKSYRKEIKGGEQKRDFIYIKDAVSIVMFFIENKDINGIFNAGTGKARTFKDLTISTFMALNLKPEIEYIEMPETLKEKYQYYTEANMEKLRNVGYDKKFYSLEEGVKDYTANYLDKDFKLYD